MKYCFHSAAFIMMFLFVFIAACNEEDDFYWCGCNDDGDYDALENDGEATADGDMSETADEDSAGTDGDTDTGESVEESENQGEQDAEEVPFVPADCLSDAGCTRVMVAAHRGYHAEFPDNTLAAVRAAFDIGADFVEVDVLETADDVLVLSHENNLADITDGTGSISESNWDDIKKLNVKGGDSGNPESAHLATFADALAMARDYGRMLYVDVKTGRGDLIVEAIRSGNYYKEALVRDEIENLLPMLQIDSNLLVMPPVDNAEHFDSVISQHAAPIVEIAQIGPNAELGAYIKGNGVKIQQDVMGYGDLRVFASGDYSGWKEFVEAGVLLLQTDMPDLLIPAVRQYNRSGVFPESAPED